MPDTVDALVVGAGPGGTATALRLGARGHRVMLVDKATFPRDKCCSEYASPATVHELDLLDVLPAVRQLDTTQLTGSTIHTDRGDRLTGGFPDAATGLALPRRAFDAALLDATMAAGIPVRQATRLESLHRDDDGRVTATLRSNGNTIQCTARVVIGADGLRSRVARMLGPPRRAHLRRMALVTHIASVRGLDNRAELHVGRRGYVGLNPIGRDVVNLALVIPAEEAAHVGGDPAGYLRRRLHDWSVLPERLDVAAIGEDVMVTGPFDHRARRATGDGVALVGDAADFFDPFTGEGIWTALAGARLLTDTLAPLLSGTAPITDRALTPYRRARRRTFAGKWLVERTIGHAMQWPALFRAAVRRLDRAGLGDTAIGICGDCIPARRILSPHLLWRLATG
jgi:flavin-dependent dehydrogenase